MGKKQSKSGERRQYGTLVSRWVDFSASFEQKEQVLQTMREWPSGTDPVVRLYLEASSESEVEALLKTADEMLGLPV